MIATKWLPTKILPVYAPYKSLPRQMLTPRVLQQYHTKCYSTTHSTSKELPSFFTYNSGRARRKRKLRSLLAQKDKTDDAENGNKASAKNEAIDNRTISDILFPNPFKDMPPPPPFNWPKSYAKWKETFALTWRDYKETWVGFTTSRGILAQDQNDEEQRKLEEKRKESVESKKKEILRNVRRNRRFLQVSAMKIREEVRTRTGISNMEDIKRHAADAMRLATECLQQFMAGYRKGRDDEVEKMLTQYFQELEQNAIQQAEKKPRRKIKRRILNRYHPMTQE